MNLDDEKGGISRPSVLLILAVLMNHSELKNYSDLFSDMR